MATLPLCALHAQNKALRPQVRQLQADRPAVAERQSREQEGTTFFIDLGHPQKGSPASRSAATYG